MELLVLAASFPVPQQLHWKEELPRLSTLNRKMMWSSSGYVVLNILFFAIALLLLHQDFLFGARLAGVLALFAFVFWGVRLILDRVWLTSEDWPAGVYFRIGHSLLTALFLVFWGVRLILDRVWLTSEDWPHGVYFRIGHSLLTALFLVLTISYGGLTWYCLRG